uniref:Uncharacterized protein n=1 Tax=Haptolina ericina TaxID=156174 RepID=A0A7S3AIF8_9EUKA|mmetsp:Transcript_20524/g.45805  ORF Transcript_20524/g.45805 Transcript_20524/m.45805 type:complete len:188 (+) Transcript_20524:233-796(+)|eukprot:CAMPEP_0181200018 /NCGR_PEP_ID=MMETSP1096-20121128/17516_1 /TAXON_ID=156174 ORGANISM="Chrysochromulina ericina, Strain CCMP281" /NCGR_SAMPLE_ID=MMETSP1096 /ASSEMBLY_ACC=CAM_ASM_000453 /LENGTH=187 /DNA_ID=CAMNT_0023290299 /DNA_START=114 /DNA_END=677 /DNA_ORIENTATION=+
MLVQTPWAARNVAPIVVLIPFVACSSSHPESLLAVDANNGLFAAEFQVPTLVQVFFVIQCIWTGVMGFLCTYDPALSPINDTGEFTRKGSKEKLVHPNVRGSWCVRGGSMFLVAAGALYFGTRETYLVALAAIIWREAYDCVELLRYKSDGYKIVLRVWWSPLGPMPPLLSFNMLNVLAMWAVLKAD